jgi:hypothetical protein
MRTRAHRQLSELTSTLLVEAVAFSEVLNVNSVLTWLLAREAFLNLRVAVASVVSTTRLLCFGCEAQRCALTEVYRSQLMRCPHQTLMTSVSNRGNLIISEMYAVSMHS